MGLPGFNTADIHQRRVVGTVVCDAKTKPVNGKY